MYNTFGLYFHGSWSDPRSFSSDLVLAGNASAIPGQHWGCSIDVSFQIPEMRGAAVLNSVNRSGESLFLLFMHCCFMNHVLLQDSTVVPFLPVPPPPFWCPHFSMFYCHCRQSNTDLFYSALPSLSPPQFIYFSNKMIWLKTRVIYMCLKAVWQGLGKYRSREVPYADS